MLQPRCQLSLRGRAEPTGLFQQISSPLKQRFHIQSVFHNNTSAVIPRIRLAARKNLSSTLITSTFSLRAVKIPARRVPATALPLFFRPSHAISHLCLPFSDSAVQGGARTREACQSLHGCCRFTKIAGLLVQFGIERFNKNGKLRLNPHSSSPPPGFTAEWAGSSVMFHLPAALKRVHVKLIEAPLSCYWILLVGDSSH